MAACALRLGDTEDLKGVRPRFLGKATAPGEERCETELRSREGRALRMAKVTPPVSQQDVALELVTDFFPEMALANR